MEYKNIRIDHGKVIQIEAKQYGNRREEGGTVIGETKKEITRPSRQMAQGFDIYSNLSAHALRMVCSRRRIVFR